ncbi:MAG: hydrolase [Tepidisphaeraceae bacterium]
MRTDPTELHWIQTQADAMRRDVIRWADINSGSYHLPGLTRMLDTLEAEFASLGGERRRIQLPPASEIDAHGNVVEHPLGEALLVRKRPDARVRVLLNIHYDTVYGPTHPFQRAEMIDPDTCRGPGVVDAKGGIVVMLTALRALERTAVAGQLGWEVLLNPDEEIGSPGSAALLREAAARNHVGLVFEPAMRDGSLVGQRKGSGNLTAVVRGRAAHAGRDFAAGRSAILALADLIGRIDAIGSTGLTASQTGMPDVTINCGRIEGGGATNIVPDLAIGRFNVRVSTAAQQHSVEQAFRTIAADVAQRDGITIALHGGFTSPPKPLDARSAHLMDHIITCGRDIGLSLTHGPSGGTCDGNKLAAAGLPVVDSLGPVGGDLHSDREYLHVPSLVERAKLTALLLMKLASGEIAPPA